MSSHRARQAMAFIGLFCVALLAMRLAAPLYPPLPWMHEDGARGLPFDVDASANAALERVTAAPLPGHAVLNGDPASVAADDDGAAGLGERAPLPDDTGCPALPDGSCFMGIQPHEHTVLDALERLRRHPWVGEVNPAAFTYVASWSWSGQQPAWIEDTRAGQIVFSSGLVSQIIIPTRYRLGDVYLAARDRNAVLNSTFLLPGASNAYTLAFADEKRGTWGIQTVLACGEPPARYWQARVILLVRSSQAGALFFDVTAPSSLLLPPSTPSSGPQPAVWHAWRAACAQVGVPAPLPALWPRRV